VPGALPEPLIDELSRFAGQLADLAGQVIKPYFRKPIAVETKADRSPVTEADREAERRMRAVIADTYPEHGIIGEEFGRTAADADIVWLLDPIDGTKSFVTGNPLFGTLIAVVHRDRPVIGVIDHVMTGERWLGIQGRKTRLNGEPVATRACPRLAQAVKYAYGVECYQGAEAAAFTAVGERVAMRRFSADCYAYGLLASGFVDLVMEDTMNPWDYSALVPVVEGAGGVITDWRGEPLGLASDGRVLASGDATLHAETLGVINA